MSEHRDHLDRVRLRITTRILEFHARQGYEAAFHADDLRSFVIEEVHVAPASADRVLRDLRQHGTLDYIVLSRRQSLYQFVRQQPPPKPPENKWGTDDNGQFQLL
jgi:hypothetical protein